MAGTDLADLPGRDMAGMDRSTMPGMTHGSVPSTTVSASVDLPNQVRVEVVADPARAGAAVLTLTVRSPSGDLVDPPEVNVTAALPAAGISPITLTPVRVAPGRFTVDAAPMLLDGTWSLTVTIRTTEVDAGVGSVEIPLGPA
jgi:copper transport protein